MCPKREEESMGGEAEKKEFEKLLRRAQGDDFGWARVLLAAARRAGQVRDAVSEAVGGSRDRAQDPDSRTQRDSSGRSGRSSKRGGGRSLSSPARAVRSKRSPPRNANF